MSAAMICLTVFVVVAFLCTVAFVAASMNSSRMSQQEENGNGSS